MILIAMLAGAGVVALLAVVLTGETMRALVALGIAASLILWLRRPTVR
jgi:hypothetical protein